MKYLLAILLLIPTMAYAESYVTDTEVIDVTATAKAEKLAKWIWERDNAKSVVDAWTGKYNEAVAEIAKLEAPAVTVKQITADVEAKAEARKPVAEIMKPVVIEMEPIKDDVIDGNGGIVVDNEIHN